MATPLTDSINALTTYANEVTGQSDTTLSDAVHTLASGYGRGEWDEIIAHYVTSAYGLFRDAILPNNTVLDFHGATLVDTTDFLRRTTAENLVIKNLTITGSISNFARDFKSNSLTFVDCVLQPTTCNRAFQTTKIISVLGTEIDMSNSQTNDIIYYAEKLEDIRFKKSTIHANFTLQNCKSLNTNSLISIANALDENNTSTLSSIPTNIKTLLTDTTGTVVDSVFVADESGTMSLGDFIANVKGWTLA